MILLRLISLQYARKHLLRTFLTMTGIVLGVAVFVGMHMANQSVLYAFNRTVSRIAGATQLQVSAGEAGFQEDVLERVQAVPGVSVAVPVVEAVVGAPYKGQGNILILGVDMTGDRSLRDYDLESGEEAVVDDPLVFLAQPDSLIVTNVFAAKNNLQSGSRVPMQTMEGEKYFVVRGIMKSSGLSTAFGGNLAIMDVYAAQAVFGRGRRFDRIDIGVVEGEDVEAVRGRIRKVLGSTFEVDPPSARGQQFESMLRIYSVMANMTSLFALFIGLFIIFNTFAIAVTQRRSEIGILRALGATRRQIRSLFLAESAAIGVLGSAVGIFAGVLLARALSVYVGGMIGEVYGIGGQVEKLTASPWLIVAALGIGVVTSVVAAIIPARSAARIDPVQALQKGRSQVISVGENRLRRVIAAVVAGAALACLSLTANRAFLYVGYFFAILAGLLLTPTLTAVLTRALRPVLKWISPVEGALAADSLIQAPRRTSGTVAALMLSLALVVGLAGLAKSSYGTIEHWTRTTLNPDLFVSPTESLTRRTFQFPRSMGAELLAIEGIEEAQPVRNHRVTIRGLPAMLVAVDVKSVSRRVHPTYIAGTLEDVPRDVAAGRGVHVSDNFARLRGVRLGDTIDIPSPTGVVRMPVKAIVVDHSDQQGTVIMDWKLYNERWKDDGANIFRVYLTPGADPETVKARVLERFSQHRRIFVMTNREVRDYIMRLTDQWFGLTYVQIAVAVLVAILGIVNTLTVSITDRRRELGVLQAVGALRRQVRRTIWLEALAIGVIGVVLGLAFGAIQLYYSLNATVEDISGLRLQYQYPYSIALVLLPIILLAAFLAALGPGEQAVRGSLVEALEYE